MKPWSQTTLRERIAVGAAGVLALCVLGVLVLAWRFDVLLGLFLTGAVAAGVAWVAWWWVE